MSQAVFDYDFTLALNNRTGKYFTCQMLIGATADLTGQVRYWRVAAARPPKGLLARILGRLALMEINLRLRHPRLAALLPKLRPKRAVVFTDPRECILYDLTTADVVLCHDLGPVTHPALYDEMTYDLYVAVFAQIKAARPHMLFVSDASRQAFTDLYGKDFPLLGLVYSPIREGISSGDQESVAVSGRFLLTVGSIGARKNQARCIEAFARSGLHDEGFSYVICGGPEPGAGMVIELARKTPGVILPGYLSDSQVRWLYAHASGFVLPSLLEGFGLPAAEAIAHRLIPLVGPGGALHEVTGDSALFADPDDPGEIAYAMRELAFMDEDARETRLTALTASIQRFSRPEILALWRAALLTAAEHAHRGTAAAGRIVS